MQEAPRDEFGAAVMIGHVEAVEARPGIVQQGGRRGLRIERTRRALLIGDLPEAGDDAADFEAGSQEGARGSGHRMVALFDFDRLGSRRCLWFVEMP